MYIQLEAFEGPLDLLLNLIEKNKINLYDIPMTKLTQQYLEVIQNSDMEGISEFLVMAATLLEIKSRMLLPKYNNDDDEDPREELVKQLIAYKRCQELAWFLKNNQYAGTRLFKKPEEPLMTMELPTPDEWLTNITLKGLWGLFSEIMQKQASKVDTVRQNFGTVQRDIYTVRDKCAWLARVLNQREKIHLSELFSQCKSKEECVVTFLALLEMVKQHEVLVKQNDIFSEIEVRKCTIDIKST